MNEGKKKKAKSSEKTVSLFWLH